MSCGPAGDRPELDERQAAFSPHKSIFTLHRLFRSLPGTSKRGRMQGRFVGMTQKFADVNVLLRMLEGDDDASYLL